MDKIETALDTKAKTATLKSWIELVGWSSQERESDEVTARTRDVFPDYRVHLAAPISLGLGQLQADIDA